MKSDYFYNLKYSDYHLLQNNTHNISADMFFSLQVFLAELDCPNILKD